MAKVKVTLLLDDDLWGIMEAREDGYTLEEVHELLMEDPVTALRDAEIIACEEYP
jgi:hypothetical protein